MPPVNTIVATQFTQPGLVSANGQNTSQLWKNPQNLLFVDNLLADSNTNIGSASDVTIGGYNFEYQGVSLSQDAIITGIEIKIIGRRNGPQTNPQTSLTVSLYDNLNGSDDFYPYTAPVTNFTESLSEITLGSPNYLFASSFTADQIKNMKLNLSANGNISIDSVLVKVYFYLPAESSPATFLPAGCEDCNSPIQVQEMRLEFPFLSGQTEFFLKKGSFAYPDGTPVQPGDVGSCGGQIPFVFDNGKKKADGNFEENAVLDTSIGFWEVLPSGVIRVDLGAITQRGLNFKAPGTHVPSLMSNHDANSTVIISNNTPYNLQLLRRCQAGVVFSEPILVQEDDFDVISPATVFNFKGAGVQVVQNPDNPEKADINITGSGTVTPSVVSSTSVTSGNVQVPDITWEHTSLGINRLLAVQVSLEGGKTVTGITYNGVALTLRESAVQGDTRMEIWTLTAPPVGTYDIVVTFSADSFVSAGAQSFINIDQSDPIGNTENATGTSTTPTLNLTTQRDNSIIVDGVSTAQTPILIQAGPGQVLNWAIFTNTSTRQGGSSVEIAGTQPDVVTMSFNITQNTAWSLCAIELQGIEQSLSPLEVEEEDVSISTNVTKINFKGSVDVTETAPGEVDVEIPQGTLEVEDDGVSIETGVFKMNFTGSGVNATQTNPGEVEVNISATGGVGDNIIIDQKPNTIDNTYGEITGDIDGANDLYVVSTSQYVTGTLKVYVNGLIQENGVDFTETVPGSGSFTMATPLVSGDILTVSYQSSGGSVGAQAGIQWQDEGVDLGTPGTVNEVDFVGPGVEATRVGDKVTVTISGGGGGGGSVIEGISDGGFLALAKSYTSSGSGSFLVGDRVVRDVFYEETTNRIYINYSIYSASSSTAQERKIRSFKNDTGSFYLEANELFQIPGTSTSIASPYRHNFASTNNHLYVIGDETGSNFTSSSRFRIYRYNFDGTGETFTDIYVVANKQNSLLQYRGGAVIVGSSLFVLCQSRATTSDPWVQELREYTFTGMTFTLANTYSNISGVDSDAGGMSYDPTDDVFYISKDSEIFRCEISGTDFVLDDSKDYEQDFLLNNNSLSYGEGFAIKQVVRNGNSLHIPIVQELRAGNNPTSQVTRLEVRNYPIF